MTRVVPYSYLVGYTLVDCTDAEPRIPYFKGHQWAEPSVRVTHFCSLLRGAHVPCRISSIDCVCARLACTLRVLDTPICVWLGVVSRVRMLHVASCMLHVACCMLHVASCTHASWCMIFGIFLLRVVLTSDATGLGAAGLHGEVADHAACLGVVCDQRQGRALSEERCCSVQPRLPFPDCIADCALLRRPGAVGAARERAKRTSLAGALRA